MALNILIQTVSVVIIVDLGLAVILVLFMEVQVRLQNVPDVRIAELAQEGLIELGLRHAMKKTHILRETIRVRKKVLVTPLLHTLQGSLTPQVVRTTSTLPPTTSATALSVTKHLPLTPLLHTLLAIPSPRVGQVASTLLSTTALSIWAA